MKNTNLARNIFGVAVLMLASVFGFTQTATTSTTLSAAVTSTNATFIQVASATGISAPSVSAASTALYIDRELLMVTSVSGTLVGVQRGAGGTRAMTHANAAVVYVGAPNQVFAVYPRFGTCTAANELNLPQIVSGISGPAAPASGYIFDCFGGNWQLDDNLPRYKLTLAPSAPRSAGTAVVGAASSLVSQAGGAQSATTSNGGAGGTFTLASGAGGAGGTSSGTGGAGGALSITSGVGAGTVTGGAGGLASFGGGAGGNGSSAGGSGGGLNLFSGAAGSGGTGTSGAINIRQGGAAGTAAVSVSTAGALTLASTVSGQAIAITPAGTGLTSITNGGAAIGLPTSAGSLPSLFNCGAALAANGACANTVATAASAHIIFGSAVLSGSASTITGISPAYTSTSTFFCVANDVTTRANPVQMVPASASTVTITNTTGATDTIQYICVGY